MLVYQRVHLSRIIRNVNPDEHFHVLLNSFVTAHTRGGLRANYWLGPT